jgi:hypothetical protein
VLGAGLLVGYLAHGSGGGTLTVTETHTVTAPAAAADAAVAGASPRSQVALAVLNGSGESGLAHRTAQHAETLGYVDVLEGDAPSPATTGHVYFRPGSAADARQAAKDLGLPTPTSLPQGGEIAQAVDATTQVVVVLGPSGAAASPSGTSAVATSPDATAADARAADTTGTAPVSDQPAP